MLFGAVGSNGFLLVPVVKQIHEFHYLNPFLILRTFLFIICLP